MPSSVSMANKTINLPKPRHHLQGRPREMEPGLLPEILPLNPSDRAKGSSKSCSGRTNPNNITDSLKHIVLDWAQELLGTLENYPDGGKATQHQTYPKNNPTGRFPACETCDFKLYTDKIYFEHEARNAFLSFSCFLHFP